VPEEHGSIPWCATIASISYGTIIGKTWVLRRSVESDIGYVSRWISAGAHVKRLDARIQVLVINGVLIVPQSVIWSCDLISNPENPIIAGIGFDPDHRGTRPGHDGWLLAYSRADGAEIESCRAAAHALLLIGDVVIHVALTGMRLAPGVLVWNHILCFGEIGGALILVWNQVTRFNQDPVRRYVVIVAAVIVRSKARREVSSKWIDPCARTDPELVAVQAGAVCVRAARTQVIAAYTIASKTAGV